MASHVFKDRTYRTKHSETYLKIIKMSLLLTSSLFFYESAYAENEASNTNACPTRPKISTNRWQENWDVLKNPCVPKKIGDDFKYIPFGDNNYLSLGANIRERFEVNNNAKFGTGNNQADSYLIQRLQAHADVRIGDHLQLFTQLSDARAFDKKNITSTDQNRLDIEQAFIAWVSPLNNGTFKFRVGRQEMAFDLQRFISNREGPNVRQAFDGVWSGYEYGDWRILGYLTRPVQIEKDSTFNDHSKSNLSFSGFRVDKQNVGDGELSGYYSRYKRDNASFPSIKGNEVRDLYDLRHMGKKNNVDWDVEGMLQHGKIGGQRIQAWALSSITGYTFADQAWSPRLGLQFDIATGDKSTKDNELNTFNQLFANGSYFTLAGYSGYSNIIHLKPSLTLKPSDKLTLLSALGFQWRETTKDAIYFQGNNSMANTAGQGSSWTGAYIQLRADRKINSNLSVAAEGVHFEVGDTIKKAGGKDANYLGLELKYGW